MPREEELSRDVQVWGMMRETVLCELELERPSMAPGPWSMSTKSPELLLEKQTLGMGHPGKGFSPPWEGASLLQLGKVGFCGSSRVLIFAASDGPHDGLRQPVEQRQEARLGLGRVNTSPGAKVTTMFVSFIWATPCCSLSLSASSFVLGWAPAVWAAAPHYLAGALWAHLVRQTLWSGGWGGRCLGGDQTCLGGSLRRLLPSLCF